MSVANMILLAGAAFVGSLLAAVAGFGGAAILLPLLVAAFGVREAIPILTVAQLLGNLSRAWFNRSELDLPVGLRKRFRSDGLRQVAHDVVSSHGSQDQCKHHNYD